MKTQIRHLHEKGFKIRAIAKAVGVSRNTVRAVLREQVTTFVPETAAVSIGDWQSAIDIETIVLKYKKGRTFKQLYSEYQPRISYSAFCRGIGKHLKLPPKVAIRLEHLPGEKTFIDYCDGIPVIDRYSGVTAKTQLFCGVLPFSSLTFGEFSMDQKIDSFISSHERMWTYFGGVTPYVVVDNLKSGVHKAHLYDPDVNPTYCEYGNHAGFAVLPARPYTPRDKASIEAAIGVIQKTFYHEVAERKFYSLTELNRVFREFLDRLNLATMKDYGVSRRQRFEEEAPKLLPLPINAFERSEWKDVTVHPDCHVQILKNFYSVPYAFVGQKLRARIRGKTVEIFTNDIQAVTAHVRLMGVGKYSTCDEHYPEFKKQLASFEIRSSLAKAEAIGDKAFELMTKLFEESRPLRRLRLAQGITRLARTGRFSNEAINYACAQALTFRKHRLAYITSCAEHFGASGGTRMSIAPPHREDGAAYLHSQEKS